MQNKTSIWDKINYFKGSVAHKLNTSQEHGRTINKLIPHSQINDWAQNMTSVTRACCPLLANLGWLCSASHTFTDKSDSRPSFSLSAQTNLMLSFCF